MEEIEYVRVRGGDPLVRFKAEYAERYESTQTMELREFIFEQFEDHGETINAEGRAGAASVQLDTGNVSLTGGVRINVESEDIIIKTAGLEWRDKEKLLFGESRAEVDIERSDGTNFTGIGFTANARNRTWTFAGEVKGTYVEEDEDKEDTVTVETATEDRMEGREPDKGPEGEPPAQSRPAPSSGPEDQDTAPEPVTDDDIRGSTLEDK